MPDPRSLTIYNNSADGGFVAVTQVEPTGEGPTVVWLSKYANPGGRVRFGWTFEYSFVWTDVGTLVPGVKLTTSQFLPADLVSKNFVRLVYDENVESFKFTGQENFDRPGQLVIMADQTVPVGMASLGFAQSGAPVRMQEALPNMTYSFQPPQNSYFVGFAKVVEKPHVISETWAKFEPLSFPPGIARMDATLAADLSWTIAPTHLI
jgi:hypothetical protein